MLPLSVLRPAEVLSEKFFLKVIYNNLIAVVLNNFLTLENMMM